MEPHYRHEFEKFRRSFALLSPLQHADCAIVFVHGWGGDPFHTWSRFHSLIDEPGLSEGFYEKSDLYFFRYESQAEWVHASTDRLLNFLDQMVLDQNPAHFVVNLAPILIQFPELADENSSYSVLPAPRQYRQIILVGHSEGGVVVRNAVLKRFKSRGQKVRNSRERKQLMQAQLCLFAPAIAGFRPAGFVGLLMKLPGLGQILQAFMHISASYQDLAGPDFLEELRTETEQAARRNPSSALRAGIIWGYSDRTVHPSKYEKDLEEFVEKDHVAICKPSDEYLRPIEFVARAASSFETVAAESE